MIVVEAGEKVIKKVVVQDIAYSLPVGDIAVGPQQYAAKVRVVQHKMVQVRQKRVRADLRIDVLFMPEENVDRRVKKTKRQLLASF